jgi:hypothetical protein
MRFYEFADLPVVEDTSAALDARKRQLDNQAISIANRKKALANLKAQKANRDAVAKMAPSNPAAD